MPLVTADPENFGWVVNPRVWRNREMGSVSHNRLDVGIVHGKRLADLFEKFWLVGSSENKLAHCFFAIYDGLYELEQNRHPLDFTGKASAHDALTVRIGGSA